MRPVERTVSCAYITLTRATSARSRTAISKSRTRVYHRVCFAVIVGGGLLLACVLSLVLSRNCSDTVQLYDACTTRSFIFVRMSRGRRENLVRISAANLVSCHSGAYTRL